MRTLKEQTDVELDAAGRVIAVRGIRHDITQQIEAARRIHALAYIDSLTGLPNRALFGDTVQQWLGFAARRDLRCAVVVVALPRIKVIADALGPDAADAALKMVGGRLRDALRTEDLKGALDAEIGDDPLARLGADEFGVLLVDIGNPDNVLRVAQRLSDRLGASLVVQGQELALGACLGIALTPGDGADAHTLLRNAGTAVRAAQAAGQSRVCLYSESMSRAMQRRHTLETELRHAVEQGELRVVYQAKVDARTGRIVGAEALARWQHPQRGSISPAEFIPIAEESGLIVALTHVVLDLVGAQLATWRDGGLPPLPVSVNLDGQSLQSDGLVERIRSTLTRFALPTSLLELEVTETGLMQDLDASTRVLRDLKGLGIKLAIDDFGTGYSSLTYLKRFPLDILKIDRSFIKDLPSDANDAALTAAIVAMGQSLQLELIAEGVETWEQADFLAALGCHVIQGFLFSKPLPAEDFARLLVRGVPGRPAAAAASQAAVV